MNNNDDQRKSSFVNSDGNIYPFKVRVESVISLTQDFWPNPIGQLHSQSETQQSTGFILIPPPAMTPFKIFLVNLWNVIWEKRLVVSNEMKLLKAGCLLSIFSFDLREGILKKKKILNLCCFLSMCYYTCLKSSQL